MRFWAGNGKRSRLHRSNALGVRFAGPDKLVHLIGKGESPSPPTLITFPTTRKVPSTFNISVKVFICSRMTASLSGAVRLPLLEGFGVGVEKALATFIISWMPSIGRVFCSDGLDLTRCAFLKVTSVAWG